MFKFLSSVSLRPALNVSDKSHGREVGCGPTGSIKYELCFDADNRA